MTASDGSAKFAKVLLALQSYLSDLVVVGGWAHRLYAVHESGRPPGFDPLMTEDADIATRTRLAIKGESIADLLLRAGFNKKLFGDEKPPVSRYQLGDEDEPFYLEFLVPLTGSGQRRGGTRDATASVAGVTAQRLRYVNILLTEPWLVRLSARNGFPVGRNEFQVQIANPVSYLVQKMLVLPERAPDKQPKDMLYIHDTLQILAYALDDLPPLWTRLAATLHRNVQKKVNERRVGLFAAVTDRARGAAQIAAGTNRADPPSAQRLVSTCQAGQARIFGPLPTA